MPFTVGKTGALAPITLPSVADWLAVTPDSKTVCAASSAGGTVTPVDTATNSAGTPIAVPGAKFVEVSPDGKVAYVSTPTSVVPIDAATQTAKAPIPLGDNVGPIAFSPDSRVPNSEPAAVA